jgi:hypothetical protein
MTRIRHAIPIMLALLALGAETSEPDLRLRASPRWSLAGAGNARNVLLTAEIVGPETEEYYCPKVVWIWGDGTRSTEESDCEPFETRSEFPRLFRRRVASPGRVQPYRVCVELRKADKKIDRSCTKFSVR